MLNKFLNAKKNKFKVTLVALCGLALLISSFQNCGGDFASLQNSQISSMADLANDELRKSDLAWSSRLQSPDVDAVGRISRWPDLNGKSVNLVPPLIAGTRSLNLGKSGKHDSKRKKVQFDGGSSLSPSIADLKFTLSDSYTIGIAFSDLVLPTAAPHALRIIDFSPVTGEQVGSFYLDILVDQDKATKIIGFFWFDDKNYAKVESILEIADLAKPHAVAIRIDKDSKNLMMAVDGSLSKSKLTIVGSPPMFGKVTRSLVLHNLEGSYGSIGTFELIDLMINLSPANDTRLAFLSLFLANAAGGNFNLPTPTPTPVPSPTPTPTPVKYSDLTSASSSLGVFKTSCFGCHSGSTLSGGLDLSNYASAFAKRATIRARVTDGSMPTASGGGALPADKKSIIQNWVDGGAPQ